MGRGLSPPYSQEAMQFRASVLPGRAEKQARMPQGPLESWGCFSWL